MLDVHRLVIVVFCSAVDHDGQGGTALEFTVWDHGGLAKRRRVDFRVLQYLVVLPATPVFCSSTWTVIDGSNITALTFTFY